MKIIIVSIAAFAVAIVVYAALDASRLQNVTMVLPQVQAESGVLEGPAVDKMPFTGTGAIVYQVGAQAGTNEGFQITIQIQSAPNSTGTFANVTGSVAVVTETEGELGVIPYDFTGGHRYLRAVITSTNDVAPVAVTINSYP
jgi:hypothetical protein